MLSRAPFKITQRVLDDETRQTQPSLRCAHQRRATVPPQCKLAHTLDSAFSYMQPTYALLQHVLREDTAPACLPCIQDLDRMAPRLTISSTSGPAYSKQQILATAVQKRRANVFCTAVSLHTTNRASAGLFSFATQACFYKRLSLI